MCAFGQCKGRFVPEPDTSKAYPATLGEECTAFAKLRGEIK